MKGNVVYLARQLGHGVDVLAARYADVIEELEEDGDADIRVTRRLDRSGRAGG
jgi:hypothetical protein